MADQVEAVQYTAILIHDPRISADKLVARDDAAGASTYDENTPRPGVPVYDRAAVGTAMTPDRGPMAALDAFGEQDGTEAYRVRTVEPGMPGDWARMVWQPYPVQPADPPAADERWRGWDTENVGSRFLQAKSIETTATPTTSTRIGACRTADNKVCFVYVESTETIESVLYDPDANTLSTAVTVADLTSDPNDDVAANVEPNPNVDVVLGPNGRLICLYTTRYQDPQAADQWRLGWAYSDDNGANWRMGGNHVLDDYFPATDVVSRIRAAYHDGQVLVLVHYRPTYTDEQETPLVVDVWVQIASDDAGATFDVVHDAFNDVGGSNPNAGPLQVMSEIMVDRATGHFVVIYVEDPVGAGGPKIYSRRIRSPYEILANVTATEIQDAPTLGAGLTDLASWEDPNGRVGFYFADDTGLLGYYSRDGGVTWVEWAYDPFTVGGAGTFHNRWVTAAAGGRVVAAACEESFGYASGHRYFILGLGGWTTVTQPRGTRTVDDHPQNVGWGAFDATVVAEAWLPPNAPDTYGWTANGAGTDTDLGSPPWGRNIATTGNARYWSRSGAFRRVTFAMQVNSGGSLTGTAIGLRFADNDFDVDVRFSTTQIRVYDRLGAATVTTQSLVTTQPRAYLVSVGYVSGTAYLALYYRDPDTDDWQNLIATSWASTAGTGPGTSFEWGHIASSTSDSDWHYMWPSTQTGTPDMRDALWRRDITTHSPAALTGAPIPAHPYQQYIDDGLLLQGTAGPFAVGDQWSVAPSSDYPATAMIPSRSPSPRVVHRTVDDASLVRYTWEVEDGTDTDLDSASKGFVVVGNVQTVRLRGWNGAAWTTIVEADAAVDFSQCSYTLSGNRVMVNTAASPFNAGGRWVHYNEFVGATMALPSGKLRRIRSNTEGAWTASSTKRPMFLLEGIDGTEAATGDCAIWSTVFGALKHEHTTVYRRYCIEVPIQSTVDGYFELALVPVGGAVVLGQNYSWGRVLTQELGLEVAETADRFRRVRRLAPERRVMQAQWVEGVSEIPIWADDPAPRWVGISSGGEPVGALGDQATLIEGLVRRLGGGICAVIPRIDADPANDETLFAGRESVTIGRLLGEIQRDVQLGDENRSELVRIAGLTISEEV